MPTGADENDSFEKDEELENSIFSKLQAGVRPRARRETCLGLRGSPFNLWGSSSLPHGKSQAPISKEAALKGLWNIKGLSLPQQISEK